ncbi:DoxX family protein [Vogesella indigofera]|uniref:DoxX family protein n=1 Tax=Vogesella indigofera TaxID=45465 RepID=UPI00234CA573|nr:DoxX family protein [Vogesella indigofera]MDC7697659.1 DoxX family protein [Vogesella indigofera]MDC7700738.1 DoxX family protein [Vogesella indigofera]MDC7703295.1 DoxX family protein [Vogesella indigofera]MDC7710042.1 DoxX family protein [Vogesella indigofera]
MIDQRTAPYAALILRLALGLMFVAHGALKLFVFTPDGTVGYFASLGLPAIFAYLTIAAELGGGVLLLLGVATRPVALALIPLLIGAGVLGHGGNGWVFSNQGGGWEYPAFLVVAAVVQVLLGDGAAALKPVGYKKG